MIESDLEDDEKRKQDMLANYLVNKYREAGNTSKLDEAVANQSRAKDASLWGDALSGLVTAVGQSRGYQRDGSFFDRLGSRYDGDVAREAQGIRDRQAGVIAENQLSLADRQNVAFADEDNPESETSKSYQSLIKTMLPSSNFSGLSATKIKQAFPAIEGMYRVKEQSDAKREAAESQRRAMEAAKAERAAARAEARTQRIQDKQDDYERRRADQLADDKRRREERLADSRLSVEMTQRLDNSEMGAKAVEDMSSALEKGDWTFSIWGDNNFTEARTRFEEALGRMQSGGAITDEEADRFRRMAPTARDSNEMQQLKLKNLRDEFAKRIRTIKHPRDSIKDDSPQGSGAASWRDL